MSNQPKISIKLPAIGSPLFLIFLVLKLTHTIDWSWWWVTAPLWIPFVMIASFIGLAITVGVLAAILK